MSTVLLYTSRHQVNLTLGQIIIVDFVTDAIAKLNDQQITRFKRAWRQIDKRVQDEHEQSLAMDQVCQDFLRECAENRCSRARAEVQDSRPARRERLPTKQLSLPLGQIMGACT